MSCTICDKPYNRSTAYYEMQVDFSHCGIILGQVVSLIQDGSESYFCHTHNAEEVDRVRKMLFMACKETETLKKVTKYLPRTAQKNVIACSNGSGHALNYEEEGEQTFTEKRAITPVKNYIVCPGSSELKLEICIVSIDSNANDAANDVEEKSSRKRKRCPENWQRIAR
ncbi:unnamed protein product [Parnassius apollo]|uniref:(apollo) hypothetical protein n=1 Tax=Parnassius apollo TaxID=110799 RepID=A0A8S3WTM5_PARAO|nr:unnamed protein product [Parnassius apollo]